MTLKLLESFMKFSKLGFAGILSEPGFCQNRQINGMNAFWHSPEGAEYAEGFLMSCPHFQWVEVYLMKQVVGCEDSEIRVFP